MRKPIDLLRATIAEIQISIRGVLPQLPPHVGSHLEARARWVAAWSPLVFSPARLRDTFHPTNVVNAAIYAPRPTNRDLTSLRLDKLPPDEHSLPVLFEAMEYDLYVEFPTDSLPVGLNSNFPDQIVEVNRFDSAGPQTVIHYRLEIGNEVGTIVLAVLRSTEKGPVANFKPLACLELEVYPRKIDYHIDYRAMLAEIARIEPALIFEASGRTSIAAELARGNQHSTAEWYQILRAISGEFFHAIDRISVDPHRRLEPRPRMVLTERARRVRPTDYNRSLRIFGNTTRWFPDAKGTMWPRKVWERTSVPDFDNEGNRYVRWLLSGILTRLGHLEHELRRQGSVWTETVGGNAVANRWLDEIAQIKPQIRKRLAYEWVSEAGEHQGGQPSPTLEMHPLYSRVFESGRALLRGLNVGTNPFTDIASRPISVLYEYWCFLAIIDLLRRHGKLEQCSAVQVSVAGSGVSLRRGRVAGVVFRHRRTGKRLNVLFNKRFPTPTTDQIPDASIHIEGEREIYIFDAKYRVQFDSRYVATYGGIGPQVDDISTMHRYRDAIVHYTDSGEYRRLVHTACVLFPWSDFAAYRNHVFYGSLETVGVGGLPFLPSCTDPVAESLERIVASAMVGNS